MNGPRVSAVENRQDSTSQTFGSHQPLVVNDVHSQLNATRVKQIVKPADLCELRTAVAAASSSGLAVSVMGGRHAMGGQQFAAESVLVDMTALNRLLSFDHELGLAEVEAGAFWPEFTAAYLEKQEGASTQWGFAQKQTGADDLSIGGTLAANGHGRGLTMRPFGADVESFTLVNAQGGLVRCRRHENAELFGLVTGGYGLLGIVYSVTLRLVRRRKIQRVVDVRRLEGLIGAFEQRIACGYLYGDFQFAIDPGSDGFLDQGVFSCYRPVDDDTRMPLNVSELSDESWKMLLDLAHGNKSEAFRQYSMYYLSTNGQLYWSDTHQMSIYPAGYHDEIDRRCGTDHRGTEIITEIDVPRSELASFLVEAREDFRKHKVDLIYGTVRLIEQDQDSYLPWAKQQYACTIFNLHTPHTKDGLEHSASAFRRLIDMAIRRGGNYFLTYHRFATREQLLTCYPQFPEFLRLKRKYDPAELFQSEWYRHYRLMFRDLL
ncbi:MAG TPA: FAD-binding oxidoreductase [Acidobacteriaceae bacterium]|nr:FAD-binding oxidoreductase [Acidobacteriaceae bacterium]